MITLWMGREIDKMTREEAIDALNLCAWLLDDSTNRAMAINQLNQALLESARIDALDALAR